jgi:hypothetical protein
LKSSRYFSTEHSIATDCSQNFVIGGDMKPLPDHRVQQAFDKQKLPVEHLTPAKSDWHGWHIGETAPVVLQASSSPLG